jgi:ABC-type branched-subunit amino acid transport system ATPase component
MVDDLVVRFGGVAAVRGLTLAAPVGRVTGLIGPNGAGKSTTFNACSGLVRPASGRIAFDGVDLTHAPAAQRAHCGIGRTFQRMELFESLSVYENVALGREARLAGVSPLRQLLPRRAEGDLVRRAAEQAISLCDLASIATQRVRSAWSSWLVRWPASSNCYSWTSRPPGWMLTKAPDLRPSYVKSLIQRVSGSSSWSMT